MYHNSKQNGHQQAKSSVDRRSTSIFGCAAIKAQQKIYYNIFKVEEGVMKVDVFKKLENTEKTQKTPLKELAKAEEIRKEYFNNKNK